MFSISGGLEDLSSSEDDRPPFGDSDAMEAQEHQEVDVVEQDAMEGADIVAQSAVLPHQGTVIEQQTEIGQIEIRKEVDMGEQDATEGSDIEAQSVVPPHQVPSDRAADGNWADRNQERS